MDAMGSDCSKPAVVAEQKSYGFELSREGKAQTSCLRFSTGDTVWINNARDLVTIKDAEGLISLRYKIGVTL